MPNEENKTAIVAWPEEPAAVVVRDTVPVCIRLCEPVCADSRYEIGMTIFDKPVATITVKGTTRFYNCREGEKG
jgi:hypothetical protein